MEEGIENSTQTLHHVPQNSLRYFKQSIKPNDVNLCTKAEIIPISLRSVRTKYDALKYTPLKREGEL
jgi:hypothetical protein